MSLITWGKEYEIGVSEMDNQHQKWIEIINKFYDNIRNNEMKETLKALLKDVVDYTDFHFSSEEKFMESIGYPAINDQKSMHKLFKEKMSEYKRKLDNDEQIVSLVVTNDLKSWLNDHIKIEDKKYAGFQMQNK